MNSNPFQKNTCSENVEFSLSFSRSQKVSTGRKEPPERVFFRERRAQSRHGRREKVIEWGAVWGGRVSNLRERVMSRAPIQSFFFSFFLWEGEEIWVLKFFRPFFPSHLFFLSLSLILDIKSLCLSTKFCFVWTRRRRRRGEKMVRFCFCFARERWSKIGRTLSRGAIRVAFRWTRKDVLYRRRQNSGFFSFL